MPNPDSYWTLNIPHPVLTSTELESENAFMSPATDFELWNQAMNALLFLTLPPRD